MVVKKVELVLVAWIYDMRPRENRTAQVLMRDTTAAGRGVRSEVLLMLDSPLPLLFRGFVVGGNQPERLTYESVHSHRPEDIASTSLLPSSMGAPKDMKLWGLLIWNRCHPRWEVP